METLFPFEFHGVDFTEVPEHGQAVGTCIFCEKEGHFYVNVESGQWDCKRCGKAGNTTTFLEQLLDHWRENTTRSDYLRLKSLRHGVCHSSCYRDSGFVFDGARWLFPCRTSRGTVQDVRVYVEGKRIIGTKGCSTGLFGSERLVKESSNGRVVWICEGEWDTVATDYLLRRVKANAIAVGVPGANVFKGEWAKLMAGRDIVVAYDADKTGDAGMEKVKGMLQGRVRSLRFIRWPLDVDDGFDVSDLILAEGEPKKAWNRLNGLLAKAPRTESLVSRNGAVKKSDAPSADVPQEEQPKRKKGKPISFADVVKRYRRWFELTDDSVMAMRCIFSVVFSNHLSGDPLWLYIVAPPGSGKTALLNPLRSVPDLCVFRSSLTTHMLVSGFQASTDPSLIPQLFGKTLVLKDLTELLSAPMHVQEEVFSTLRGAYDGLVERSYGNAVFRKYEGTFSFVSGVTVQIHGHSRASMGERMLKFQLIPHHKTDHESVIRAAMRNTGNEGELDEDLFEITSDFLSREIDVDRVKRSVPQWAEDRIVALAQLIAKLRTEVERDFRGEQVRYRPQDEVATRLGKQLKKMAMLLTLTNDDPRGVVTESDFKVVERVAFDTAIGWSLDVVQAMMQFNGGQQPVSTKDLVDVSGLPRSNIARKMDDLLLLRVIEKITEKGAARNLDRVFYRLMPSVVKLWNQAKVAGEHFRRVATVAKGRKIKIRRGLRRP